MAGVVRTRILLLALFACVAWAGLASAAATEEPALVELRSQSQTRDVLSVADRLANTNKAMVGKRTHAAKHRFRKLVHSARFAAEAPQAPSTQGSTQQVGGTTVVVQATTRGPFPLTEDGHIPWTILIIILLSLITCMVMVFTSFGQKWCMRPLCLTVDLACEAFLKSTKFIWAFFAGIFGFCFYPFKATFWWCYDHINQFYRPYLIVT